MKKPKSPREKAARALCKHFDLPENITFEGRPMWESMLEQVDIVLITTLTVDEWLKIKKEGP